MVYPEAYRVPSHDYGEITLITGKDFAYMVAFGIAAARLPSETTRT
ncbi:hypothetical protein [Mycobacterium lepromatosis]|nr:hypothetical protein [Mycobacterium lepromatosis]UKN43037.1 hypothetical protein MLPF_3122 [Mycobacterium lepromatosis]